MNWETLLCLGDSITIGSRSYLGYPEYCGQHLSDKTKKSWNVVNHATSGFTTIDLVRSVDISASNLRTCKPEVATILIGTNDLKNGTDISIFKTAYEQLVIKTQLIVGSKNIILLEIPELERGVMLPYNIEMNSLIRKYNEVINTISADRGLMVIKLKSTAEQFYDGVYLNEEGSKDFGKQIAEYILKLRGGH